MAKITRDREKLQERRMRAADMFDLGMRANHVAKELGVSREAASTWKIIWKDSGRDGLNVRPLGARRRLSERDIVQLRMDLEKTPIDFGIEADGWSLKSISALISERFGIVYHFSHISHLLKNLGIKPW